MRWREIISEEGKIVVGVNSTCDVQPGEIQRQGAKMGFNLDADGLPPIWTGLPAFTNGKDTVNKGDPFYDDDGINPKKAAPKIIKESLIDREHAIFMNPSRSEIRSLVARARNQNRREELIAAGADPEILDDDDTRQSYADKFTKAHDAYQVLRGLIDVNGNVYVVDSWTMTHFQLFGCLRNNHGVEFRERTSANLNVLRDGTVMVWQTEDLDNRILKSWGVEIALLDHWRTVYDRIDQTTGS